MTSNVLLFLYLSTLYLTWCDASDPSVPKLYFVDANVTNEGVTETQHATCKIATEELVASARTTVTRVLTGACNAKTIEERLQALEKNLTQELDEMKTMLRSVLQIQRDLLKLPKPLREETNYKDRYENYHKNPAPSPRQLEIDEFNNTIQEILSINGTVFLYYWQIKNFNEKLASWKTTRSERTSTFYIGQNGYAMYIKATPRYFPDGTVFMGVGLTRGRHDSFLKWPFTHKMRLEVLDHSSVDHRQDRRSRIWDPSTLCSEYFWGRPKLTGEPDNPECVGLSVPRQVLYAKLPLSSDHVSKNTRYIWNGSVTIKLTVFL
ncbi:uncharacterized protein LOC128896950 [Hylaeus anthracinus]|uniref:uncharacterized protein LOC128896950 n=1 Tax=Hylaeus anthracinus TaxID=313031 RepID=UPI0023B9DC02|nr:uncharacterized protein LOC128896950 [Hylaeus anthracinus]